MKKIVILFVVFLVAGWIVKEIVMPNFVAASISANEYQAYFSLRTFQEACVLYKDKHGTYPESLEALDEEALTKGLGRGRTKGYRYYYEAMPDGYVVRAVPTKLGHTRRYIFEADESGAIVACDKAGGCATLQESWHPGMPHMPYPYTPGDGALE